MSAEFQDDVSSGIRGMIDQDFGARTSREGVVRRQTKRSVGDLAGGDPALARAPPCIQSDNETRSGAGSSGRNAESTELPGTVLVNENPLATSKSSGASVRFPVPHGNGALPIPQFLVQLWLLDWERQQRLTQATCPLPLHNPSSFCFFSSSLHALASLHSVVDLAHNLAFLRLLQRNLALDGLVACSTKLPAGARRSAGSGGLTSQLAAAYEGNNDVLSSTQGRPLKSYAAEVPRECFPLSVYRCLLALNRGRIKGSFCRSLSSYAACACTGLTHLDHLGTDEDSVPQAREVGSSPGYGGSFLNLLHELATKSAVLTKKASHAGQKKSGQVAAAVAYSNHSCAGSPRLLLDAAEARRRQGDTIDITDTCHCYSKEIKQLSSDAVGSAADSDAEDAGNRFRDYWSTVGCAVASSVQTLEDEWRLSSVMPHDAPGPQRSKVVAMYRELMGTIQLSAGSPGYHSAFGSLLQDASSLQGRYIRSQDTHEFLNLLIEEMQKECGRAGRLQEVLKSYLEWSLTRNAELCTDSPVLRRLPRRGGTSDDDDGACGESRSCAVTTPTGKASASSTSDTRLGAHSKRLHLGSGGGADGNPKSSEFISCNGSLWSLIPEEQLKSVFVGTLQESLRCLRCGVCSAERSTPFWCIHVTLSDDCASDDPSAVTRPSTVTLERLLDVALGTQRIEDVECTSCSVFSTLADLRGRLGASPLLAAARVHGVMAIKEARATEAFDHAEVTPKANRRLKTSLVQLQPHVGEQEPIGPSSSILRDCQDDVGGARDIACCRAMCHCRPSELTVQDVAALDRKAVEGFGVETMATHLDDVPGLFSSFWYLPASVVSAWVRVWCLLFRLRRFLMLRGMAHTSHGQNTRVVKGTKRSTCQQRLAAATGVIPAREDTVKCTDENEAECHQRTTVPGTKSAGSCEPSSSAGSKHIPETDEELRSAAGDLWVVERSPKEKLQRVDRMPTVLIIQVNALKLTQGGQVYKEQKHCVYPFLLDATFMTRSNDPKKKVKSGKQAGFPAAWLHATNDHPDYSIWGSKNEQEEMCGNTAKCATSTSVGGAVSDKYGGLEGAPCTATATAVSDTRRECWCGLYHLYELRAVITHAGTTASEGHFACYRRWDAHAFIPGAACSLFVRQFLSGISPAALNGTDSDGLKDTHDDPEGLIVENADTFQHHKGGWHQLRHRVRQWLLHAARVGCKKFSFAWISDDCVRRASSAEVQAAQPYLLFYEKVSPSVF